MSNLPPFDSHFLNCCYLQGSITTSPEPGEVVGLSVADDEWRRHTPSVSFCVTHRCLSLITGLWDDSWSLWWM